MIARIAAASLAMIPALAGQAVALSCLQPDPVRHYESARDAEARFIPVLGRFDTTVPINQPITTMPVGPDSLPGPQAGRAVTQGVQFTGHALGRDGFDAAVDMPVTVALSCAGAFCASELPQGVVLTYLEETDGAPLAEIGPCGGRLYTDPSAAQIDAVLTCHADGICTPAPR